VKGWSRRAPTLACCAALSISPAATGDDDKDEDSAKQSAQATLNPEQQRAVGVVVAHPVAARAPERIQALGLALDATTLVSDMGEASATAAAEHAASAELVRLHALHDGGAGVSRKVFEAAQAEQAKAQAQAQVAAANYALHWSPLAALPPGARQKVIDASTSGRSLLVRAEVPGRHILGAPASKALLDVDGIEVPGRVLGLLRQTTELQSVGLLIEVPNAPQGLGPGARIPVALLTAERSGLLLPREALLYDENGAYVYKQVTKKAGEKNARYAPVKVALLLPYGEGWLVQGIDDDDNIVVRGAGVLWSLQRASAHQNDDDD
jgi:hypothetical protein